MPKIVIDLEKCRGNTVKEHNSINCPFSYTERTPRSGYADDYKCHLLNRTISGYVEWEKDVNPVPNDCPLLVVTPKEKKVKPVVLGKSGDVQFLLTSVKDKNYLTISTPRVKINGICLDDIDEAADIVKWVILINQKINITPEAMNMFIKLMSEYKDINI